jgi:hypothetical protein
MCRFGPYAQRHAVTGMSLAPQTLPSRPGFWNGGGHSWKALAAVKRHGRLIALLLLILQLGLIAHRIEHYLLPDAVESSEDSCDAFSPLIDPPALPTVEHEPTQVSYIVRFWVVREAHAERLESWLGFRAQAPPRLG